MKKVIAIVVTLTVCVSVFAQTDIKSFNKVGPDVALNKLKAAGIDITNLVWNNYDGLLYLEDEDGKPLDTFLVISDGTYELNYFYTNSDKFCFLSDYVDGGLKVGDPVSKAMSVDFSSSRYGRGNKQNNCTQKTEAGETFFIIFGETAQNVSFEASAGVISRLFFDSPEDETRLENYDYSIKMF